MALAAGRSHGVLTFNTIPITRLLTCSSRAVEQPLFRSVLSLPIYNGAQWAFAVWLTNTGLKNAAADNTFKMSSLSTLSVLTAYLRFVVARLLQRDCPLPCADYSVEPQRGLLQSRPQSCSHSIFVCFGIWRRSIYGSVGVLRAGPLESVYLIRAGLHASGPHAKGCDLMEKRYTTR